jgi:predicted RNA-binding Zn-ribbon protein involved in translation (DUF1610 family)
MSTKEKYKCKNCGSSNTVKNGTSRTRKTPKQKVACSDCGFESTFTIESNAVESVASVVYETTDKGVILPGKGTDMKIGMTETELRKKHDASFIIKAAAEGLKEGVYLTDYEFMQLCKLSVNSGFRRISEQDQFDMYRGRAQKIVYWSHPNSISKMKSQGVLS